MLKVEGYFKEYIFDLSSLNKRNLSLENIIMWMGLVPNSKTLKTNSSKVLFIKSKSEQVKAKNLNKINITENSQKNIAKNLLKYNETIIILDGNNTQIHLKFLSDL